jgi:cytochrome b561
MFVAGYDDLAGNRGKPSNGTAQATRLIVDPLGFEDNRMSDTREKLSGLSVGLHWIIALAMIGMVAFGLILEEMPRSDGKSALVQLHKSIGVTVLGLALVRLFWRVRQGMPAHVGVYTALEQTLAKVTHAFLLLATLLLPLSGLLASIGNARAVSLFGMPFIPQLLAQKNELLAKIGGASHAILGKLIIAAILLHVIGAVKHHLVDRDGTLRRMLGARVTPTSHA